VPWRYCLSTTSRSSQNPSELESGRICLGNKKINFSQVFAGQAVGIKEVHDDIWLVSSMEYDLGYFDLETRTLEPLEHPFGPKVLPM
jgi:putative transposase